MSELMMKKHVAIFAGGLAEKILTGEKTVECRFSKKKITPFGEVNAGDLIYIKPSGEEIIGEFRVKKVIFIDGLLEEDIEELKKAYELQIAASESFWEKVKDSKFVTIIYIGQSERFITSPIRFTKKDARGWVVLE
jgi:hypothetical protein